MSTIHFRQPVDEITTAAPLPILREVIFTNQANISKRVEAMIDTAGTISSIPEEIAKDLNLECELRMCSEPVIGDIQKVAIERFYRVGVEICSFPKREIDVFSSEEGLARIARDALQGCELKISWAEPTTPQKNRLHYKTLPSER